MISTDDDTFVFVLLFVGFKVETASDVVINKSSVPFWIFGMPALHGIVFSRCAACDQVLVMNPTELFPFWPNLKFWDFFCGLRPARFVDWLETVSCAGALVWSFCEFLSGL